MCPMPKGLKRYYGQRHLHFITCSCYRRLPLLRSAHAKNVFARILTEVRQGYGFALVGYVVMPEHIHLFIGEPEHGTPSTVMQVLKQRVSHRLRGKRRAWAAQCGSDSIVPMTCCHGSGSCAFMISMFGAIGNESRSCTICT
jgi:REP element-mobilizing transposase RayT